MQLKFHPHPLTASLPPSPLSTQIPRISLHLASAAAALVIRPSRMRDGNRRRRGGGDGECSTAELPIETQKFGWTDGRPEVFPRMQIAPLIPFL